MLAKTCKATFGLLFFIFCSAAISQENEYSVPQSDLVYLETTEGLVIIQLLPQVSPKHVEQFKQLVSSQWYNGLPFYRVIEGFVAQAGEGEGEWNNVKGKPSKFKQPLKAEFTQPVSDSFTLIQSPDLLAPQTGFINSVPAGRDLTTNEQWFLHCSGTVAMARGNGADSASSEFYIVIGHAPRHLDRNMSVFGRVVFGMDVVQRLPRGDKLKGGIIDSDQPKGMINSAHIGDTLTTNKQYTVKVQMVESAAFQQRIDSSKNRTHEFYTYPGNGNIDVCYYQPSVNATPTANNLIK
ncbi:peptidylprolyl isomerase [Psychrosphaera sp. B3R10]|uniref:peptidylprolyl isomerase n=1 Tax=unclassified Psychrosphaera TaxID=2641570 RepID=UPI001C0976C0|nr:MULTISPECIES: peptidylprolyl isomerase [unclassified Psychrosphaera]MBU2883146.1 peptidylprolyl isomerase [Psychrosphaera sp. I2R16]MBU2988602.1 peptidylprolyl isomerase [Psychrosphaera sp. B3R10]